MVQETNETSPPGHVTILQPFHGAHIFIVVQFIAVSSEAQKGTKLVAERLGRDAAIGAPCILAGGRSNVNRACGILVCACYIIFVGFFFF